METTKDTFCPASMCPLIAKDGSPWTGQKNVKCIKDACGFFHDGHCEGSMHARCQADEVKQKGFTLTLNPAGRKFHNRKPMNYDCPRSEDCQWQQERGGDLCPPRYALSLGLDPRVCLF